MSLLSKHLRPSGLMLIAAATGMTFFAPVADAGRYRDHVYRPGYVVAESDWGHGTIKGAVRPWRHGWQVRLPRGTWIDCGRDCSETLRRATVDFWESQGGDEAKDAGPGYLRWEFRY